MEQETKAKKADAAPRWDKETECWMVKLSTPEPADGEYAYVVGRATKNGSKIDGVVERIVLQPNGVCRIDVRCGGKEGALRYMFVTGELRIEARCDAHDQDFKRLQANGMIP